MNDAKELVQAVHSMCLAKDTRDPKIVFIDMPRAMDKTKLGGIYSAIEQIKNGYLYDMRYKFSEWWIDSPQVWVFTNIPPKTSLLSADRWKLWVIDRDTKTLLVFGDRPVVECHIVDMDEDDDVKKRKLTNSDDEINILPLINICLYCYPNCN